MTNFNKGDRVISSGATGSILDDVSGFPLNAAMETMHPQYVNQVGTVTAEEDSLGFIEVTLDAFPDHGPIPFFESELAHV